MSKMDELRKLREAKAVSKATRSRRGDGLPGVDLDRVGARKSVAAGIRELMSQPPRAGEKVGVREREFIEKRPRAVVKKGRPAAPVQRMSAAEKAALDEAAPTGRRGRPKGPPGRMLSVKLPPDLVEKIDQHMIEKALSTRNATIESLIRLALLDMRLAK